MRDHTDNAFLIHSRPYTDSRMLVDIFSEKFGMISGVYRLPRYRKNMSLPWQFLPIYVRWTGRHALKTILNLEQLRSTAPLKGVALYCGFYINELLLRLLPKDEPHQKLYSIYSKTIEKLGLNHALNNEICLRQFELTMLQELGYGLDLSVDCEGGEISYNENIYYIFEPEKGFVKIRNEGDSAPDAISGATIADMAIERFDAAQVRLSTKKICRKMINHLLGDTLLKSRELFRQF